jgi:sugar/nucleoside kinase (ribokinase family)
MSRAGFVTAGTWCVDLNKLVDALPVEDAAYEIETLQRQGGGAGFNMAMDLRRLDGDLFVEAIGLIGDDEDGRLLFAQCDALGVAHAQLQVRRDAPTQSVDAFTVKATGRRAHLFHQGVAALLTPDHFEFAQTRARFLHLGLPGAHRLMDDCAWRGEANGWAATLKAARAAGLTTNLELMSIARGRLATLTTPCLPHLDLLVVNDFEIGAVAGVDTLVDGRTDVAAVHRAIDCVFERGAMRTIAVHFPAGAIAATRDARVTRGSVAVPTQAVVGANGAGDAFAAGFLYGRHADWPLDRSLALGHAAAAASIRALSTTEGVEGWRDCMALAERWGWREAPG